MTGDHDHDWEEDKKLVERFENSLKSNLDLYFEEEELEDIIRFYFDQQKFLKALRASEYSLEKFPFSVEIRLLKAQCLIFNDELDEGLSILENLNNLSPNNEDIVLALANAQILAGNHQEGIELLENYLPMAEDKAEVFYSLGNLYRAKGDNTKASDYFTRAHPALADRCAQVAGDDHPGGSIHRGEHVPDESHRLPGRLEGYDRGRHRVVGGGVPVRVRVHLARPGE